MEIVFHSISYAQYFHITLQTKDKAVKWNVCKTKRNNTTQRRKKSKDENEKIHKNKYDRKAVFIYVARYAGNFMFFCFSLSISYKLQRCFLMNIIMLFSSYRSFCLFILFVFIFVVHAAAACEYCISTIMDMCVFLIQ